MLRSYVKKVLAIGGGVPYCSIPVACRYKVNYTMRKNLGESGIEILDLQSRHRDESYNTKNINNSQLVVISFYTTEVAVILYLLYVVTSG